jgi:membrane protein required for colicin V production
VTLFDLVVVLLLLVSGLVGFVRGATRELITVAAFLGGALVAVFALRFTGPIARAAIDPEWAGNAAAILIVFLAVYILLRVLIGVFHLVFHAATPKERLPTWMTESASYPLSGAAADGLRVFARESAETTDGLGPAIRDAVVDGKAPGDEPVQNETRRGREAESQ